MNIRVLSRCAVVSAVIALITPMFTSPDVVAQADADGVPLPAVIWDSSHGARPLPEMRELFGFAKYRYMVATGLYWREGVPYLLL